MTYEKTIKGLVEGFTGDSERDNEALTEAVEAATKHLWHLRRQIRSGRVEVASKENETKLRDIIREKLQFSIEYNAHTHTSNEASA